MSTPADQGAHPPAGFAPPAGPPPATGAPPGQPAPPNPNAPPGQGQSAYAPPAGPPPGQSAYPPPPGAPGAPPGGQPPYPGAYGGYYPPPQGYPGQQYNPYGPAYPGYYPGYPPPPGQYPPPPGAPGGPPAGAPPSGTPGTDRAAGAPPPAPGTPGQYPAPGAYPAPGYYPPPGQYPPPPGAYPPPPTGYPAYGAPYGAPPAVPGFPTSPPPPPPPGAGGYPGFAMPGQHGFPAPAHPGGEINDPQVYLGVSFPLPGLNAAPIGETKVPGYNPNVDFHNINKITPETATEAAYANLTKTILALNPFEMDALNDYCIGKTGKGLADRIDKINTGNYGQALRALTFGPLGYDVELINKALAGFGTNETLLTELLLGRPAFEIRWLKKGYKARFGRDLTDAVKSDLSGKLERMYIMALNAQKPNDHKPPVQSEVADDIEALNNAAKKRNELPFFEILINRSDAHLAQVIQGFSQRYKSLSKVIKKNFSGTMMEAFLFIVHGVKPKRDGKGIWRDAKNLEKTMAGLGTKDTMLIYRLVRAHWDSNRLKEVKDAYQRRYGKQLESRVKGETSGPYRDLLIAIVKGAAT